MAPTSSSGIQHHRSSRAEVLARDVEVQNLVEELRKARLGNWTILANCIERCRAASVGRAGWRSFSPEASSRATDRYRCKTLACPTCGTGMWRRAVRKTLGRFRDVDVHDLSIVTVAGSSVTDMEAVRVEARRMRRSIRDHRDAMTEKRASWGTVRIGGLVDLMPGQDLDGFAVQPVAQLLVHHPHVPRGTVEGALRDWFAGSGRDVEVSPYGAGTFVGSPPGTGLPMLWRAAVVATLFEWHRGLEPLRVVVGPRRSGQLGRDSSVGRAPEGRRATAFREPMPTLF